MQLAGETVTVAKPGAVKCCGSRRSGGCFTNRSAPLRQGTLYLALQGVQVEEAAPPPPQSHPVPAVDVLHCPDAALQVLELRGPAVFHAPTESAEVLHGFGAQGHEHDLDGVVPLRRHVVLLAVSQLRVFEEERVCGVQHVLHAKAVKAQRVVERVDAALLVEERTGRFLGPCAVLSLCALGLLGGWGGSFGAFCGGALVAAACRTLCNFGSALFMS